MRDAARDWVAVRAFGSELDLHERISSGFRTMGVVVGLVVILGLAWFFWTLYRFAKADGDLTILSKGPLEPKAFEDKVVWITGASQGIGEILAKEFASNGAKLILSSRRPSELERVKSSLTGKHAPDGVVVIPFDLAAGEAAISEAVLKAESAFDGKGVDIMVHNASGPRPKMSCLDISESTTQAMFAVNVLGTITLTRLLVPQMINRGRGQFVLVSSAAGKVSAPGQSVYAATKHAVNGYFETLRSEVGYSGIKVTIVCPGPVQTDTTSDETRQPLARVTELIMKAIYHELEETLIATQCLPESSTPLDFDQCKPVLSVLYLQQYFPGITSKILQKIGPKRVRMGNTYSMSKLLGKEQ